MPNEQSPPQAAPSTGGQPDEVVIQIDWTSEPTPVYANGAQVVHTQREFSLTFTDFAGLIGRGAPPGEQEPRARVVSSIRVTPDVFFQLAAAASSNWNKYVNRYGDPNANAPKFQLLGGSGFQLEGVDADGPQTSQPE